MDRMKLLPLLQIAGGTFPTGAFSQSWGLETYVAEGKIHDLSSFRDFLASYTLRVLATLEGPALCRAYELTKSGRTELGAPIGNLAGNAELMELDCLVTAMRLTRESREGSKRTGKALLRVAAEMTGRGDLSALYAANSKEGINMPVAFGILAALLGASLEESLLAFLFNGVNGLVQSAVKLVPLGNSEAQKLVLAFYPVLDEACSIAISRPMEEASAFCPAFDLASIRHETLMTRLYMS
jgi:urease accessory protein